MTPRQLARRQAAARRRARLAKKRFVVKLVKDPETGAVSRVVEEVPQPVPPSTWAPLLGLAAVAGGLWWWFKHRKAPAAAEA